MHNGVMDTNRATTLLTRAALGAVIAIPTLLLVDYLEKKVAFKECVMEELMGEHGDRQSAQFSYSFRGAGGDNDINGVDVRLTYLENDGYGGLDQWQATCSYQL